MKGCLTTINCGLNILLLPKYGVAVSAYIFMLTYLIAAMMLFFISNKYYKLSMEWGRLISALLIGMAAFLLCNIMNISLAHSIIGKVVITITLLLVIWLLWLEREEKNKVVAYIKHFKK